VSVGGKYAHDFTPRLRLSASWQHNDATLDYAYAARTSASQPGGTAAAFNERSEHIGSAKLDYRLSDALELYAKGYYHRWDSRWTHLRNVIGAPGTQRYESNREFWGFKDYGLNVLTKLDPGGPLEYFAGYDYQNYGGRDDVLLIAPSSETVHALFGQVRTTARWLPDVVLAGGARYNAPSHGRRAAVWNVSGQWSRSERLFVKGNFGTAFRLPDAYELFAIDPSCCAGNPNLRPEQSRNLNVSVGGRLGTDTADGQSLWHWEIVGFHREVRDLIADVDDGTGSGNTIAANVADRVRVNGYELIVGADWSRMLSANLAYTSTHSTGSNGLSGNYSQIPGIPDSQLQASLDVHARGGGLGASLNVTHVGQVVNTVAGFGQRTSGDYTVVDVSGRVLFGTGQRHRFTLSLQNVFDSEFVTRYARGYTDATAQPVLTANIGAPRTVRVAYGYSW
jgi:vitamin B12 transporter